MNHMRVANAPCSWGALEFDLENQQAALGYSDVLDEMREAGYEGTELGDWGFMPTDPAKLRNELVTRDLSMLAAFVPVALANGDAHDAGVAVAIRTAQLLAEVADHPLIVLADDNGSVEARTQQAGRITPELGMNATQWSTFVAGAERVAREVRETTGIRTVFHHHAAGYIETPMEVATLMERTDPGLLGLCFDTGHYLYGSGPGSADVSASVIRQYADRIWHVHFKDCDPGIATRARELEWDYFTAIHEGVFCELGEGAVNFQDVVTALEAVSYRGWIVVEQDVLPGMGSPLQSATRNRDYLRQLGL